LKLSNLKSIHDADPAIGVTVSPPNPGLPHGTSAALTSIGLAKELA